MFPNYNYINNPLFGGQQMQPFGQQQQATPLGQMPQQPTLGQNIMGNGQMQPGPVQAPGPFQGQHGHGGMLGNFAPLFGLSGMLANLGGMSGLAPLFGIGGGLLFSHLFRKHNG